MHHRCANWRCVIVYNIEQAACYGRSFSETGNLGFLENFYAWVTRAAVATPVSKSTGGPGWYIIDDQSAASPNPYIVISQHSAANVAANPNRFDEPHKILKVGMIGSESGYIWIDAYLWYDVAGAVGAANTGYGLYASHQINTYDSSDFVYDFRGGPNQMIIQSRRGTDWDSFVLTEWTGDANLVQATSVVGELQAGIVAGTDVVFSVDGGQSDDFMEGYHYFLYDMNNGNEWVNYVKVTDVNTYSNRLTIDKCSQDFPAGSIIGAYVHRFAVLCDNTQANIVSRSHRKSEIPYYSRYGYETVNGDGAGMSRLYASIKLSREDEYLGYNNTQSGMAPDDRARYACQRPGVQEYSSHNTGSTLVYTSMNRGYGPLREIYITGLGVGAGSMAAAQDGRTINNLNYLYFQSNWALAESGSSTLAMLYPDYNSTV